MEQNYNPKLLYDIKKAVSETNVLQLRNQLKEIHEEKYKRKTKRSILQKIGIWK